MNLNGTDGVTITALSLALDAAAQRHQVIAANIANANTPGFTAQRLSFEAQVNLGLQGKPAVAEVRSQLVPELTADGQARSVQLDAEVAQLSQNSLQYQALLRAINRQMSLLATAVSEGKR